MKNHCTVSKETPALIHFTLLLLALHSTEGIWEQYHCFTYFGIYKYRTYLHAHLHTRLACSRIWQAQCSTETVLPLRRRGVFCSYCPDETLWPMWIIPLYKWVVHTCIILFAIQRKTRSTVLSLSQLYEASTDPTGNASHKWRQVGLTYQPVYT